MESTDRHIKGSSFTVSGARSTDDDRAEQTTAVIDSPGSVHVSGGTAPILLNIDESVGKQFLLILWVSAFVSAVAVVALMVVWSAYRDTRAHVNTMQYDLAQVKAQLIEKGLYKPTSH